MNTNSSPEEKRIVKILVFVIIVSVLANIFLFIKRDEVFSSKKELISQNKELGVQVIKYKNELNKYKGLSKEIDILVVEGQAKMEEKEKTIAKLTGETKSLKSQNNKLIAEIEEIKEDYLETIDSLLVERKANTAINQRIEQMEETIEELNEQIGIASVLFGDNLTVSVEKTKVSGAIVKTAIAKKVSQIEICIDILPNKLNNTRLLDLYFVITAPSSGIMKDFYKEQGIFRHPEFKKDAVFTTTESINYNKNKVSVCTTIVPSVKPIPGTYLVEVFTDENKIGLTTFSLK